MDEIVEVNLYKLAVEINEAHEKCKSAAHATLENARYIGEKLLEVKAALKHGGYYEWIRHNCDFTERTASTYVRVAHRWSGVIEALQSEVASGKSEDISDLSIYSFLEVANRITYKVEEKIVEQTPITEREHYSLNRDERKLRWKIEQEDKLVYEYLQSVKAYKLSIKEAVEVVRARKFSPEAIRFTIRKHEEIREKLLELEREFTLVDNDEISREYK